MTDKIDEQFLELVEGFQEIDPEKVLTDLSAFKKKYSLWYFFAPQMIERGEMLSPNSFQSLYGYLEELYLAAKKEYEETLTDQETQKDFRHSRAKPK
jgi:hypothetical protein